MVLLDWIIVLLYLAGLIILGLALSRKQQNPHDYFLGSKTLSWRSIGLSTMATQLGAVSFISAPAFVGMRPKGGLVWLGYEFALPFAMIILVWKVIPLFHKMGLVSIYEFLEVRFDNRTRKFVSVIFLLSRGLATGITIYTAALVVSVVLGLHIYYTIAIMGVVAVIYDYLGGIKAVVYSDVIQMIIIFLGIGICLYFGLQETGGWENVIKHIDKQRLTTVNFKATGFGNSPDFGFLPFLFGGFFLYLSYYGFDQSQVQREISARSLTDSRLSLVLNALLRFPVVFFYCMLGLVLGAFAVSNPEFIQKIHVLSQSGTLNADYMVPVFVIHYLPAGLTGIIVVAVFAATMSSMDSALNSLSAATVEDIIKPLLFRKKIGSKKDLDQQIVQRNVDAKILRISKLVTLCWGIFCTGFAFIAGGLGKTIIETINMVGSVFYGPIAAVFILGIFARRVGSKDVILGGLAGLACNSFIIFGPVHVSWLWWNATGFCASLLVSLVSAFVRKTPRSENVISVKEEKQGSWLVVYLFLAVYGIFIILFTVYGIRKLF